MPLATTFTRSSSGRGSARSSSSIVNAPNFSRATAAMIFIEFPSACGADRGDHGPAAHRLQLFSSAVPIPVMLGLVPGSHVLAAKQDVDGRDKPGHDDF